MRGLLGLMTICYLGKHFIEQLGFLALSFLDLGLSVPVVVAVKTSSAFNFGRCFIDEGRHRVIRNKTTLRTIVVNDVT